MDAAHFINLKYGIDRRMEVMKCDSRHFTTVRDILGRVKYKFEHCIIHLYNEHGIQLGPDDVVERVMVYTVKNNHDDRQKKKRFFLEPHIYLYVIFG